MSRSCPFLGMCAFASLTRRRGVLCSEEFDARAKDAWGWVWAWLTKSMALTLAGAGQHSSLVIMSWDMVDPRIHRSCQTN